jgi:hypothetical protein
MPKNVPMRLSVAQLVVHPDPGDTAALRAGAEQIRRFMRGDWLTRCPPDAVPAIATTDLDLTVENHARPWRRVARSGRYAQSQAPDDPRSLNRTRL